MAILHGANTGHGHVWKRPDGVKTRCGGPMLCSKCARDAAGMANIKEDLENIPLTGKCPMFKATR